MDELQKLRATVEETNAVLDHPTNSAMVDRLRSLVLLSHSSCEELLLEILTKAWFVKLFPQFKKKGESKMGVVHEMIEGLLEESSFSKLYGAVLRLKILSEEEKAGINELTKLRNLFAHSRGRDYSAFEDSYAQERVLRTCKRVVTDLSLLVNSYRF